MPPLAIEVCRLVAHFSLILACSQQFQGVTYTLDIKRARLVDSEVAGQNTKGAVRIC